MSRVAKQPVDKAGATITNEGGIMNFKGPLGTFSLKLHKDIVVSEENNILRVSGDCEMALKGTFVRLIQNGVIGVTKGFEKKVRLSGVGYKASVDGNKIKLIIGLSHDVFMDIPEGITVKSPNVANLVITSCDKEKLGTFVDKLCKVKKYNVYNGNGVLDLSKYYRRKATKKK